MRSIMQEYFNMMSYDKNILIKSNGSYSNTNIGTKEKYLSIIKGNLEIVKLLIRIRSRYKFYRQMLDEIYKKT